MAEDETVKKLRLAGKNENLYHDRVVEGFLADYDGTRTIRLPEGYSFPMEPTLMQTYVAYKVKHYHTLVTFLQLALARLFPLFLQAG